VGVCPGITRKGTRCTLSVPPGADWCYNHDPAREAERRRNAARGGRARANHELAEVKELLEDLTNRVLGKEGTEKLETGPAAVANQLINTRLRAIEQERKNRETEDLEARIEALERAGGAGRKGARPWGA
jgi:hypothetical protein